MRTSRARVQSDEHEIPIDGASGPNPVLRKFARAADATVTALVPSLVATIFVSTRLREGPGAID